MIVRVGSHPSGSEVTLLDADDFGRFSVRLVGTGLADADRALSEAGVGGLVSDIEALVSVAAVRRLAGHADDPAWAAGFSAMLSYAGGKGWLTDDGSRIRAHLETSESA